MKAAGFHIIFHAATFFKEVKAMNDYPELISCEDVARLFCVNKRTILRWIDAAFPDSPSPVGPRKGTPVKFIKRGFESTSGGGSQPLITK